MHTRHLRLTKARSIQVRTSQTDNHSVITSPPSTSMATTFQDMFEHPTPTTSQKSAPTAPRPDNTTSLNEFQRRINSPRGIAVMAVLEVSAYVDATVTCLRPEQVVLTRAANENLARPLSKDTVLTNDNSMLGSGAPDRMSDVNDPAMVPSIAPPNRRQSPRPSPRAPSCSPITPK